jgi:Cu/Ag efflux protein CusF
MRNLLAAVSLVVVSTFGPLALAQTGAAVVGKGPGVAGAAQTVKVTATITAIDQATRDVTLKGPKGREVTVQLGPEVKNFAQLKVGDTVTAEYIEALTLELKKGGKAVVARTEKAGAAPAAKPGEKPAGVAGRQVTITADVTAVDPATQTVTLKGPKQTVDLKIADPEQFKLIKVGDQVEANYTEALAIAVVAAPAKK